MLIDLHAHSSGISTCCRESAEQILDTAKAIGLDGIVLTNHYATGHMRGATPEAFAQKYLDEYHAAARYGTQIGMKVFFGLEVTMKAHSNVHMLVYGADDAFLLAHPDLYLYPQDELYRLVKAFGGVMVQAHPFRKNRNALLDPQYLDGVEINCHRGYRDGTHLQELADFAARHGLILTCGGDYHADCPRPICGTYLPDSITDAKEIASYLCATHAIDLLVHEVDEEKPHEVRFVRSK